MKLNEYLAENAVKLMIKGSGEKNPTRQTNGLGMYDYVENLESVLGKMVWICDYRANADPTKKPIRNIKPTPVVVTDAKVKNFLTSKPNVTNLTRYTTNAAPAISFGLLPL